MALVGSRFSLAFKISNPASGHIFRVLDGFRVVFVGFSRSWRSYASALTRCTYYSHGGQRARLHKNDEVYPVLLDMELVSR